MNNMNERVALVTGGTRGIGAAMSTRLAQHGARIAAVYNRNIEAAARSDGSARPTTPPPSPASSA